MKETAFPVFDSPVFDGYLVRLCSHAEPETNRLIKTGVRLPEALTRSDMREIFGTKDSSVSRQTVYNFLKQAEELNAILWVAEDKAFYVNPNIYNRGSGVLKNIAKLFDSNGSKTNS